TLQAPAARFPNHSRAKAGVGASPVAAFPRNGSGAPPTVQERARAQPLPPSPRVSGQTQPPQEEAPLPSAAPRPVQSDRGGRRTAGTRRCTHLGRRRAAGSRRLPLGGRETSPALPRGPAERAGRKRRPGPRPLAGFAVTRRPGAHDWLRRVASRPLPGSRRSACCWRLVGRAFRALPGAKRTRSPPAAPTRTALRRDPARRSPGPGAPTPSDLPAGAGGIPTHHPRVYNIHSRNVTRYPANSIVVVGGCPVCRVGVLEDSFTFLGIFLAIVLFPFGFICCFALRKRRCPNCGANFT
uniref:Membrane protein BRI3 n=1 Tax=Equus caballus TaxID=9796 RepID=A0A9L0R2A7_HORSE